MNLELESKIIIFHFLNRVFYDIYNNIEFQIFYYYDYYEYNISIL